METNRSLALSVVIRDWLESGASVGFNKLFPFELVVQNKPKNSRDRVFNPSVTLLTMIRTMIESDKSLQNSLNIYRETHDQIVKSVQDIKEEFSQREREKRRGRPQLKAINIQKSKTYEISSSTSAFAQARNRLSQDLVNLVYSDTTKNITSKCSTKFYGREVYMTDGTYLQLQDTADIKAKFPVQKSLSYPRALLSIITHQGSGKIADYTLGSTKDGELKLFSSMIGNIPSGSLLLADDLYNCLAVVIMLQKKNIDIIVPGKRKRNFKVIKKIGKGDTIVELKAEQNRSKIMRENGIENQIVIMRRLEYIDPNTGQSAVIYTTLTDQHIDKEAIILKYWTRWAIEISIRELKTLLGMNIIRGKSTDTVIKEVGCSLIAYNYVREIIQETAVEADFSPKGDIYEKLYKVDEAILTDKLGRVFSHWSSGRKPKIRENEGTDEKKLSTTSSR